MCVCVCVASVLSFRMAPLANKHSPNRRHHLEREALARRVVDGYRRRQLLVQLDWGAREACVRRSGSAREGYALCSTPKNSKLDGVGCCCKLTSKPEVRGRNLRLAHFCRSLGVADGCSRRLGEGAGPPHRATRARGKEVGRCCSTSDHSTTSARVLGVRSERERQRTRLRVAFKGHRERRT